MKEIRVGITGASGYIGRRLTNHFIQQGHFVNVISRSSRKFLVHKQLEIFEADLSNPDPEVIKAFIKKVDVVYHLAAELTDHSKMLGTNVRGTQAIVNAVKGTTKVLIHLSSIGIFDFSTTLTIHEDSPKHPLNLYEESKLKAESIIQNAKDTEQINAIILRPSIILGLEMKSHILNHMKRLLDHGIDLNISREVVANFVLADDVVNALVLLSKEKDAIGENYNFSNDLALADFLDLIKNILPSKRRIHFSGKLFSNLLKVLKWFGIISISDDGIAFFSNKTTISSSKIKEKLGFQFDSNYPVFLKEYLNKPK
ncbi:NAD(P)-dependent oxidoreductase [Flavobacteriaceae bacterium]|nr:NAD(P)-dependent oxidoreductase [Flavobacteriaceae bacterium]